MEKIKRDNEKKKCVERTEKQGLFEDIPEWQRLFQDMDKHIRLFDAYRWNAYTTKENLTKKRDEMLEMVKGLNNIDLHVLYYLRCIQGISNRSLFYMLQKLYLSQCEFLNGLFNTTEYVDIFLIGQAENSDWRFLPKKDRKNYKKPEKTP
jgi:hypothetical protein